MQHRTIGMLPMSVGTSLAIEPYLAPGAQIGVRPKQPKLEVLMVNISTVIRNVIQAYDTPSRAKLTVTQLHTDVIEDLEILYNTLPQIGIVKPEMMLYDRQYGLLARQYPNAILRSAVNPNQKHLAVLEKGVITMLHSTLKQFLLTTDKLPSSPKSIYVLTHHPVDLVDHPSGYKHLNLLESHTGKIKGMDQWHTKLTNGNELDRIPFNRLTLQVFGDRTTDFKAHKFAYRQAVLALAEQFKWTPMTTLTRVKLGVSSLKDPELKTALTQML